MAYILSIDEWLYHDGRSHVGIVPDSDSNCKRGNGSNDDSINTNDGTRDSSRDDR